VSFNLTILGSGAALPTATRGTTAQYIECNNRHILIDCGEGTQSQIRKFGIKLQKITHILISHLHGDHFFGLPGLLSTMNLLGRNQGITVYGHPELEQLIKGMLEVGKNKLTFKINFVPLQYSTEQIIFEDRLIEISSFPLQHRIETCGFKIQEKPKEYQLDAQAIKGAGLLIQHFPLLKKGENIVLENGEIRYFEDFTFPPKPSRAYAFCSDTKPYEPVLKSIEKVDVLYHEATFTEEHLDRAKATFHSTAKQAAMVAKQANVKKLILGHFSSRYENSATHIEEAKSIFENTINAEDGMVVNLEKVN
jgi:ribonuclease Z